MDTPVALRKAVIRILTPLVRILLGHGVSYGTFSDIVKEVFVRVAMDQFDVKGRKQSISRVAVITGLTRKAVKAITEKPSDDNGQMLESYNRAARVIAGWRRDSQFQDAGGGAAVLPFSGEGASFTALVKQYSGDMPARAVLDELERTRAIEKLADGRVQLKVRAFLPVDDNRMKLHILGTDVSELITTIGHNLEADPSQTRLQRKVSYNNLPLEALAPFRQLTAEKAQALLEELDTYLSAQDRDNNPEINGSGRHTAGVGIYYFEEPTDESA